MKLLKYEKRNSYKGEVVDFDIELDEGVYTTVTYDEVENQMTVWRCTQPRVHELKYAQIFERSRLRWLRPGWVQELKY